MIQYHLEAIKRMGVQLERNRKHLFGKSEAMRKLAAEDNRELGRLSEVHNRAIKTLRGESYGVKN